LIAPNTGSLPPCRRAPPAARRPSYRTAANAGVSASPTLTPAADEQHERRLLVGERLHRRADAEELHRVVDAYTSFGAATRTSSEPTGDLHRAESWNDV